MRADVLVIGGGVMGASIAHELIAAGAGRVVLCEQGRAPGRGATAFSGGLVRVHHPDVAETALAAASRPVYAGWAETVGGDCGFHAGGFVSIAGGDGVTELRAGRDRLARLGIESHLLGPHEVRDLQPDWGVDDIALALYEPGSGYADPALATLGLLRRAREGGLRILEGVAVRRLTGGHERVTGAETSAGRLSAGTVVVAAGAWTRRLGLSIGLDLPITCRQIAVALLEDPGGSRRARRPSAIDGVVGTYFRPVGRDLLVGVDCGNPEVPVDVGPAPSQEQLLAARARVARRIPAVAAAAFVGLRSAFDGFSPDGRGLVGPVPGMTGLYVVAGFSGGGFKLAPAVARAVAAELSGQSAPADSLRSLRPSRFPLGSPPVPAGRQP